MNRFHTHLNCSYSILILFGQLIQIIIDVVAGTHCVFLFICFFLSIFIFCVPHATLSYFNFCVVPFITVAFDKKILLKWREAFCIHVLSESLEFFCERLNIGIKFSVMTVILCYRKFLVKFFPHTIWKTRVIFSKSDEFSFKFYIIKNQMEINIPMIRQCVYSIKG